MEMVKMYDESILGRGNFYVRFADNEGVTVELIKRAGVWGVYLGVYQSEIFCRRKTSLWIPLRSIRAEWEDMLWLDIKKAIKAVGKEEQLFNEGRVLRWIK